MTTLKVYFCREEEIKPESNGFSVHLFRTSDNWNDYGMRTIFEVKIYSNATLVAEIKEFTKIAFLDESIESQIIKIGQVRIRDLPEDFLSQLADEESYNIILGVLGFSKSMRLLMLLRDFATLKSLGYDLNFIFEKNKDVYYKSLTRYSSPYSAVNGCSSLFQVSVESVEPQINCSFELEGFENSHNLNLSFAENPILKNRVNILVGKNGVGKSQSLKYISLKVIEDIIAGASTRNANFNRVLAISNILEDAFPTITDLPKLGGVFYKYINLLGREGSQSTTASVVDILRQRNVLKESDKLSVLHASLKGVLDYDDLWLPLKAESVEFATHLVEDTTYFPASSFSSLSERKRLQLTATVDHNKPVQIILNDKFVKLSTGQQFFLNIALKVVSYISPRSLLLFEEPETYLHPNLEVDFFRFVTSLLDVADSYGIFSTHSVYLVREVMNSQVRVLDKRNDVINVYQPSIQTFGASLDTISDYIFGDLSINPVFKTELDKLGVPSDARLKTLSKFLGEDAIYYLVNRKQKLK
ncbi:hypothetical protein CIK05_10780 [Bdellovibrio sp. qaytius]|nr:hypothetical protein CIK05_10780 [Bdellovibrio sp. qaytius]